MVMLLAYTGVDGFMVVDRNTVLCIGGLDPSGGAEFRRKTGMKEKGFCVPVTRRGFLGGSAAGVLIGGCRNGDPVSGINPRDWWKSGGYVVHDSVNIAHLDQGTIRAKVDGQWRNFNTAKLPKRFIQWSLETRVSRLRDLGRYGFRMRDLAGPHNACVATYGGPTRDSAVSLNTAYKGMGFVPEKERLARTIDSIRVTKREIEGDGGRSFAEVMAKKTAFLGELYRQADLFDSSKQISLELFTEPDYLTHTFLNMMVNPIASASFLAYPTFELRAIPHLLHPLNPHLTPYERNLVRYVNEIHNFVHGGDGEKMACVYHIIEVFDDTPGDTGKGVKIA
jgi:hypothetical protein